MGRFRKMVERGWFRGLGSRGCFVVRRVRPGLVSYDSSNNRSGCGFRNARALTKSLVIPIAFRRRTQRNSRLCRVQAFF